MVYRKPNTAEPAFMKEEQLVKKRKKRSKRSLLAMKMRLLLHHQELLLHQERLQVRSVCLINFSCVLKLFVQMIRAKSTSMLLCALCKELVEKMWWTLLLTRLSSRNCADFLQVRLSSSSGTAI